MAESKAETLRRNKRSTPPPASLEALNFKVSRAFKKEFKGLAVDQDMSMIELLKEGFELSRQNRKQRCRGDAPDA